MSTLGLRAAICLAGTELVRGERQDLNGPWMARHLQQEGLQVQRLLCAPDTEAELAHALSQAACEVDLLIVSGGLGPTRDDVTREAAARATGCALVEDAAAWQQIEATLTARGRPIAAVQRRQALLPQGARALQNDVGVAPGFVLRWQQTTIFFLPGVPVELEPMFQAHVLPWVRALPDRPSQAQAVLGIVGLPETEVEALLEAEPDLARVQIGYYPHAGELEVQLRAQGNDAATQVARAESAARRALGHYVYGPPPSGRIEHAVIALLREQGRTLATAESLTGGLLAHMLSTVPGASATLKGGWVSYATEFKRDVLGLSQELLDARGVVSEAVALAMAKAAQGNAGAQAGLATTGAAGPEPFQQQGHPPVPVGRVCIAATLASGASASRTLALGGPRALIQRRSAVAALDLLRRLLLGVG